MGVNLGALIPKQQISLRMLNNKRVAIDAYNALYQFLAIIRQSNGTPLKDRKGRITSHLTGLFYRTCNLLEMGIKPIYVFDGVSPTLKEAEIKRRTKVKVAYLVKYKKALREGKIKKARQYAQMTSSLKNYMTDDAKTLLSNLGIPCVQAPSEGEAQAAYIVKKMDADYCSSQDYDSLLFGAPILLRNLTISGKRKLPRKNVFIEIFPETIKMDDVLIKLDITRNQLIDIAILIGTDFNPSGFKGVGPKTALKLVKKHKKLKNILPLVNNSKKTINIEEIKDVFLHPKITDNYNLVWKNPYREGIIKFLCDKKDFSFDRVSKTLTKTIEGIKESKSKKTLDNWFS